MFTTLINTIVAAFKAFFDGFENRIHRLELRTAKLESPAAELEEHAANAASVASKLRLAEMRIESTERRLEDLESESIDETIADHIHINASRIAERLHAFLPDPESSVTPAAIVEALDLDDLARELDYSELANSVCIGDIIGEIDLADLASEIDINDLDLTERLGAALGQADTATTESVEDLAEIVAAQAQEITDLRKRLDAQAHDLRTVVSAALDALRAVDTTGNDW